MGNGGRRFSVSGGRSDAVLDELVTALVGATAVAVVDPPTVELAELGGEAVAGGGVEE